MKRIWRAFAKVNLDLRILGKRRDGYHEIRTVLQTVDLCDRIHVSAADAFEFSTDDGPDDESNLVVRAVRAFEAAAATPVRLRLHLEKRIPIGGGLGGGSADAAVTVLGLLRHYRRSIPGERLIGLLGALGSDVPYFAVGGRVLATGRGEVLYPLPEGRAGASERILLVHPGLRIPTAEAYSSLTRPFESNTILGFCARFAPALVSMEPTPDARLNDFEAALFPRFPEIAEIKRRLRESGARQASLSGSGATVFGEFPGEREARAAAGVLGRDYGISLVRRVSRTGYFRRVFGR